MKPKYTSSSLSPFWIKCLSFKKWNWYSQLRPWTWPAKSILNEGSWSHRRARQYFRPVSLTQLRGTCLLLSRLLVVANLWQKLRKFCEKCNERQLGCGRSRFKSFHIGGHLSVKRGEIPLLAPGQTFASMHKCILRITHTIQSDILQLWEELRTSARSR